MPVSWERPVVGAVLVLSLVTLGLQAFELRPRLWPAGSGLALTGETVLGPLAAPRPVPVIRPPDVSSVAGQPVSVLRVFPGSAAARAGVVEGDRVRGITTPSGRITLENGLPGDAAEVLRVWRAAQELSRAVTVTLDIEGGDNVAHSVVIGQPPIWATNEVDPDDPDAPRSNADTVWFRQHLAPLAQATAFLIGATVLVVLGVSGTTAAFVTLALIATAAANAGPLLGSHTAVP